MSNFTPYSYIPTTLYPKGAKEHKQVLETKQLMFDMLDNPDYPDETRQKLGKMLNDSYVVPDTFDKNPGVLLRMFTPYNVITDAKGEPSYQYSRDDDGLEPMTNPNVYTKKSDEINLPWYFLNIANKNRDTLVHETAHTKQRSTDAWDFIKAVGGEAAWRKIVASWADPIPEHKRDGRTYLERMTSDYYGAPSYLGSASNNMPITYDPDEYMADFLAMIHTFLEGPGIDITKTPEFRANVFKGNKRFEKAFYAYMDRLKQR